ncbi:MAG TPA: transglutaminase domain-containing protein [Burkholderiaceae bacterium]|nr:transglutaminase domain-containing protein [Burkholderiaceae bacterium]
MTRRRKGGWWTVLAIAAGVLAGAGALDLLQVDDALTATDRRIIQSFLAAHRITVPPADAGYAAHVRFLRDVQAALIDAVPMGDGIPLGHPREPVDVLSAPMALCFDRSRVIEKVARFAGLASRHVFLLQDTHGESMLADLLSRGEQSHAVTEVRTERGWLLVDSNVKWMSLDRAGAPLSAGDVRRQVASGDSAFEESPPDFYDQPYVYVYGLYSRHGGFYPPYHLIPNVNFAELATNITGRR